MKKIILCLTAIVIATTIYSQSLPDSVLVKYRTADSYADKGKCLIGYLSKLSAIDQKTKSDLLSLKTWFAKQNDLTGVNYTNIQLANVLRVNGDFPASLDLALSTLPQFETQQDSFGIMLTYRTISSTYTSSKEYEKAAEYAKKEINYIRTSERRNEISKTYNAIACIYGEGKMPDSGMVYAQKAVNLDTELKDELQLAISTSTLGENYIADGQYDIALPFLRRAAKYYYEKGAPSAYMDAYLKNDFAEVYLNTAIYDSVLHYAHLALAVSVPFNIKDQSMRSYEYLYKSYEQIHQQDSLNKYFRLAMLTKDSLFNLEKMKSIQSLSFREEMRQQEIEAENLMNAEERQQNIQYALIALGIIIFITVFLLLSRTIIVNERIISFFAILGLLIIFEFINLLIHPWLAHFTHESPVWMLLALVVIAAMLIPLHHRLEHWTKSRLVEKNNAIRLAAAKRTIEQLDKKPDGIEQGN